jgi:hypothetical protein
MYNLTCTPRVITSYLLSIIGILLTANFFVLHRRIVAPDPVLKGFRAAFYFGGEANFPGLFTALLILASGIILWRISNLSFSASQSHPYRLLSGFLICLSFDDFFNIHQQMIDVMRKLLQSEFGNAVIGGYILSGLTILLISYLLITGLRSFPAKINRSFILGCSTYLISSAAKPLIAVHDGVQPALEEVFTSLLLTGVQLLQMIGMLVVLHSLMHFYLSKIQRADIRLIFFSSQEEIRNKDTMEDLSLK